MDAVMASIFGSAITDSKEAVLLSQDDRARCALDGVGVNFRTAIIQNRVRPPGYRVRIGCLVEVRALASSDHRRNSAMRAAVLSCRAACRAAASAPRITTSMA
jgi:hypothetical protein